MTCLPAGNIVMTTSASVAASVPDPATESPAAVAAARAASITSNAITS
jgi:hypothetical protein